MSVNDMNKITVHPQYGYGWRRGCDLIDVPSKFNLQVFSAADKSIIGQVVEPGHSLEGLYAILHLRTSQKSGNTYTIEISESKPILEYMDSKEGAPNISITGFGSVQDE